MTITFTGSVCTPTIMGNDQIVQNIFTIENSSLSRVTLLIRRLNIQNDSVNLQTVVMPLVKVFTASGISGGIILPKSSFDTNKTSSNLTTFRCPINTDHPITVQSVSSNTIWEQYSARMHTAAQRFLGVDNKLMTKSYPYKIKPGDAITVQAISPAITSNPAINNNWFVNCLFQEDSYGTFAISGQVTLGGNPVVGAKVTVLESDDELMTNVQLVEVVTTDGSGNWSSAITSGRVGSAFVQYKNGSTYYTAPGSPFLEG